MSTRDPRRNVRIPRIGAVCAAGLLTACGQGAAPSVEAQLLSPTGFPQVEWTGVALEAVEGFVISRSEDGSEWQVVGRVGPRSRHYVDKLPVTDGIEYRYRVAALLGGAEVARSGDGSRTTTASLPETAVLDFPREPLTVINHTDIVLEGKPGALPLAGYLYLFNNAGRERTAQPLVRLRNLGSGEHEITVWAQDAAGNLDISPARIRFTVWIPLAPRLVARHDGGRECTRTRTVTLTLAGSGVSEVQLSERPDLEGASWQPIPEDRRVNLTLSEGEGTKRIYGKFRSTSGAESLVVADSVYYDLTPPVIRLTQPSANTRTGTSTSTVTIIGTVSDMSPLGPVEVNSVYALTIGTDGFMRPLFPLEHGVNVVEIVARDCAGNEARAVFEIERDENGPEDNCGT